MWMNITKGIAIKRRDKMQLSEIRNDLNYCAEMYEQIIKEQKNFIDQLQNENEHLKSEIAEMKDISNEDLIQKLEVKHG